MQGTQYLRACQLCLCFSSVCLTYFSPLERKKLYASNCSKLGLWCVFSNSGFKTLFSPALIVIIELNIIWGCIGCCYEQVYIHGSFWASIQFRESETKNNTSKIVHFYIQRKNTEETHKYWKTLLALLIKRDLSLHRVWSSFSGSFVQRIN